MLASGRLRPTTHNQTNVQVTNPVLAQGECNKPVWAASWLPLGTPLGRCHLEPCCILAFCRYKHDCITSRVVRSLVPVRVVQPDGEADGDIIHDAMTQGIVKALVTVGVTSDIAVGSLDRARHDGEKAR